MLHQTHSEYWHIQYSFSFRYMLAYSIIFSVIKAHSRILRHIQAYSGIFSTLGNPHIFTTLPYSEPWDILKPCETLTSFMFFFKFLLEKKETSTAGLVTRGVSLVTQGEGAFLCYTEQHLKVVSATFLLVSFLSVNESTYQTRKSVFYFTSKALSVLEKIKF